MARFSTNTARKVNDWQLKLAELGRGILGPQVDTRLTVGKGGSFPFIHVGGKSNSLLLLSNPDLYIKSERGNKGKSAE